MADAAVEFLLGSLQQLLLYHSDLIKDTKNQVEELKDDLLLLKAFLRDSTEKRRKDEKIQEWVRQFREVVYEAEDTIDRILWEAAVDKSKNYFHRAFQKRANLSDKIDPIRRKIRDIYCHTCRVEDFEPPVKPQAPILREKNLVGFEDEAEKLMKCLNEETEQLDVIPIIGMPGLGKTTLARKIFHDPQIQNQFPVRIWIHVSQEFSKMDIFLSILKEFTRIGEDFNKKSDSELAELVASYLMSKKFLLVMDDIWAVEDWDKIQIALPGNSKGKVLITSRQAEVGWCANRVRDSHMLRFLTLEESWSLLRLEVFGRLESPSELEIEGKLIAERCCGLPLAIVVIGGILAKKYSASSEMSAIKKTWEEVSKSFNTYLNDHDAERRIENIVSLSYEKLPYHLRPCFLYVGLFPEDFEIPARKLTQMWIAEGFIQQKDNVSLEETAENYLDDLINRNLVTVGKLKANGKVKTCRIHDLIRNFCISEAGIYGENFLEEVKTSSDGGLKPPVYKGHKYRHLCIHSNVLNFLAENPYGPSVRSFVCFSKDEILIQPEYISVIPAGFKLLRVLDVMPIKFTKLPSGMYQLLHLRYIALSFNSAVLPAAFSKLWNLQTFIVGTTSRTLDVKVDILNMNQLRHFETNASAALPKTGKSNKGGEKIQTLGTISPESCTEEVFGRARNLKKLGIRGRLASLLEDKKGSFASFGKLVDLEKLKLVNDYAHWSPSKGQLHALPPANKFPTQLRQLTLSGTCLDWSEMSILGSLENLEVLKLKDRAFWGKLWEATDGGFHHLEVLHIGRTNLEKWVASHHHFPELKRLELRNCENLEEVPIGLAAYIPNFQLLDLHRCRNAAASAKKIHGVKRKQVDQQSADVGRFNLSSSY